MRALRDRRPRRLARQRRPGAAMAELAIILPIFITFAFVPLEVCTMIFVEQSLNVATYEGARTATKKLGTVNETIVRCTEVLEERGIQGGSVSIIPSSFDSLEDGDDVIVTITAPYLPNSSVGMWFLDKQISSSTHMIRE